jgi:hypothetical protein
VLGQALARRNERLAWPVALTIYTQAMRAVAALHARGLTHGALTAARVRLDIQHFRTRVCLGHGAPRSPRSDRVELARIVLPLAASRGRERQLIEALDTEDDLAVLRDHLVEQQRATEDRVLAAFADIGEPPALPGAALTTLWTWVAGCARVGIS